MILTTLLTLISVRASFTFITKGRRGFYASLLFLEAGILGALTGVIGSIQAMEVLKLIAGISEPLIGRLLLYDGLGQSFETIRYRRKG